LKKALVILFSLVIVMLPMLLHYVSAAPLPPELIARYSANSPTIDGFLGSIEWNDTTRYTVNMTRYSTTETIETWLYVKHNGTHINLGLLVWSIGTHGYDEFILAFDEGDDGNRGSGTRDYALTPLQEDLKAWSSDQVLHDGYYNVSWYAKTTEIDFGANATYETDHGTSPSEIEFWEGLGWVDDHWECEFSIPFVGNDSGTDDFSDLSCTVLDTIGMKIQYFYTGTNFYYPDGDTMAVSTYADLSFPPPTIESCNTHGEKRDNFNLYEDVFVNGTEFSPLKTFDFYIVNDTETWINGTTIPTRVAGTHISLISDANGTVLPTEVWSDPATVGKYDIVVDVNGNGLYDVGTDALDNNDWEVTAGFVIPEFVSLSLLLLVQITTLLSLIAYKRKHSI